MAESTAGLRRIGFAYKPSTKKVLIYYSATIVLLLVETIVNGINKVLWQKVLSEMSN